ncbi:MAG: tRNA lysidine(34) synthetase TilS [Pseudomonadota bacterium]
MKADAIAALADRIAALPRTSAVGIAVSGGSDSSALLIAAQATGRRIRALTVDHGLRSETASEIRHVGGLCRNLGCDHDIVTLDLEPGPNLQARAREARYAALAGAAQAAGIEAVLLGHTADDVAETLVMRLARGAGIDGLARMAECRRDRGIDWHRPALSLTRADLRSALRSRGIVWIEDPSNDDPDFERVAARRAIAALGLDSRNLAASAEALSEARDSLAMHAATLAAAHVQEDRGDLLFDRAALMQLHAADPDPLPRLLLAGLKWMGGRPYPPRKAERARLVSNALTGRVCTLAGCLLTQDDGRLRLAREVAACAPPGPTTSPWDNRWILSGPHSASLTVGALADDIVQTPWREARLPRASLLASPAIRDGTRLIAAPLAGLPGEWHAQIRLPFMQAVIQR